MAWLTLQGCKTLDIRMDRQSSNAMAIARFLERGRGIDLEGLQRITRIHELLLERMTEKDLVDKDYIQPGAMRAEFTLSIYFQDEVAEGT